MAAKQSGALGFIQHEAVGGLLLVCAAAIAIAMENSSAAWLYDKILHTHFAIGFESYKLDKSILHWVNDGLMAIFFFLIGLEIKRELLIGELSNRRRAMLPLIAAIGGIIVPATVYGIVVGHNPVALKGWAIPAATDIAFAVGVMALLGKRVPAALKVFLLALAIIDDVGAIIIIGIFYTANLSPTALSLAAAGCFLLAAMNLIGVKKILPYALVGLFVWICVLKSGVHATLAGVITAFSIPLMAGGPSPADSHISPLEIFEDALHPWIKFLVLPLFAFANAGVALTGLTLDSLLNAIPLGIVAGLFIGKPLGIILFILIAMGFGVADKPGGTNWGQILGISWLAGIGFTMSLFIGMLAFPDPVFAAEIRMGVLVGSILSAMAGFIILSISSLKVFQTDPLPNELSAPQR